MNRPLIEMAALISRHFSRIRNESQADYALTPFRVVETLSWKTIGWTPRCRVSRTRQSLLPWTPETDVHRLRIATSDQGPGPGTPSPNQLKLLPAARLAESEPALQAHRSRTSQCRGSHKGPTGSRGTMAHALPRVWARSKTKLRLLQGHSPTPTACGSHPVPSAGLEVCPEGGRRFGLLRCHRRVHAHVRTCVAAPQGHRAGSAAPLEFCQRKRPGIS